MDALEASDSDEDPRNRPKKLWRVSERVQERMGRKDEEGLPERAPDQLGTPGDKADTPAPFGRVEDASNMPRKLRKMSEREQGRSKPKDEANSPGRSGEEPGEPVGETAIVDDTHTYQEGPRGETSNDGSGTDMASRDRGPGGDPGERDELGGNEGNRKRQSNGDSDEMEGR